MAKRITSDYETHQKDDLQVEADLRGIKDIQGTGANGAVLKDDLVLALELDDESSASDPREADPKGLDDKAVATADGVMARQVPSDLDEYEGSYVRVGDPFPGEVFGLKIIEEARHNKTHLAKSPLRFWDGTKEEFRAQFDKQ